MHSIAPRRAFHLAAVPAIAALLLTAALGAQATAADLLGLYVGGSVGSAKVEANSGGYFIGPYDRFDENHTAFKAMVGIRPISWVGAEVAYVDFGHPTGTFGGTPADVTMKGESAFGLLYLPVPIIDVFVKAGVARLQSTVNGEVGEGCPAIEGEPPCPQIVPFRTERTNTDYAAGAGIQYKISSFAVRGEYEIFTAAGRHPDLLSIGLTWTFL